MVRIRPDFPLVVSATMLPPAGNMRFLQEHRFFFFFSPQLASLVKQQLCKNFQEGHWWFSGRILISYKGDLGLISGRRTVLKFVLEKSVATQSSILAWRIPQTEESGRLQSIGLQRVRQD